MSIKKTKQIEEAPHSVAAEATALYGMRKKERDFKLKNLQDQVPEVRKKIVSLQARQQAALEDGDTELYGRLDLEIKACRVFLTKVTDAIAKIRREPFFTKEESERFAKALHREYIASDIEVREELAGLSEEMVKAARRQSLKLQQMNSVLRVLRQPLKDYTINNDISIRWGNFVNGGDVSYEEKKAIQNAYTLTKQGRHEGVYIPHNF